MNEEVVLWVMCGGFALLAFILVLLDECPCRDCSLKRFHKAMDKEMRK